MATQHQPFDVLTIGLGPAGMAVSAMAAEMGLRVAAVEPRKIGGECMNVGCIPSKALLRLAKSRHIAMKFATRTGADDNGHATRIDNPFPEIQKDLAYIGDTKTMKMFEKVTLFFQRGPARFIDAHTVEVDGERIRAKRIFIAVGTRPAAPPIPGLDQVEYLTNDTVFKLDGVPASMVIIGGGAIGCEMAQAFNRLGCRTTIVHMDPHLVPAGEADAAELLEASLKAEGIEVYNKRMIKGVSKGADGTITVETDQGERLSGEQLLVGAGRRFDFSSLELENAGITYGKRGIEVNKYLQTNRRHIYAVGDCNGNFLLSHAAMHQGMIGLMNAMMPRPMRMDFRKFVVPWTVFTDPQVSHAGLTEKQLRDRGIAYETIRVRYDDYGAAIAEKVDVGFVKVHASKWGRIYGASIVGEGSGEMINEWALAIQKKIRLHEIMMLQHSFPTMGFLSKRIAEVWMMGLMKNSARLRQMARMMYRM